jgi:hypothetical protein
MFAITFIQPIFAIDIGEILVGLVALIFVIIRQLLEANKAAGVNRIKPPAAPPQPQQANQGPAPAAAQAGQQADPLRAQVEEFLRRAGRPAQQNQPRPPQGKPSEIEVLVKPSQPAEQRVIGQPLRQAEWRKTTTEAASPSSIPEANKPRQIRGSGKPRKRQSVAEHVAEQVISRAESIASKASKLGQRIVAEDQQFDVQLKSKFDHAVGTLAGSAASAATEQTPPAPESPAAQLAALLANPGGIRQAVLVNEILRRPSERW